MREIVWQKRERINAILSSVDYERTQLLNRAFPCTNSILNKSTVHFTGERKKKNVFFSSDKRDIVFCFFILFIVIFIYLVYLYYNITSH